MYTVERHPTYEPVLRPLWRAAQQGRIRVVTSELTVTETLVFPIPNGNAALQRDFERLLFAPAIGLEPVTLTVLYDAAEQRANVRSLRTPDAIHAATALLCGCALFVTNDQGFRRVPGLPLAILDDVLSAP